MRYMTSGTCASSIDFDMDGTKVKNLRFNGGCNGNGKGIAALVEGMEAQEVIKLLKGIRCGLKRTSCPDQLAKALEEYLSSN